MRRATVLLEHERYVDGMTDARGNDIAGYEYPTDFFAYVVSPKQSVEQDELGRRGVITGLQVIAPVTAMVGPHDRFTYKGVTYEVQGEPGVWDHNPHFSRPRHGCVQFDLERAEG